ncbi:alpha-xenorhabdolysin family binary toxin subunit B [Pseudomonas moraviensis]|uniref:alpha-xenorhabdolysin family binary toxin subunit B n=1 Tax=Pseudomonas moraviensis TaxID=321662 RepID=UPI0018D5B750|nr:alpha-xenorhabdolysin family binary toxin subunit B [Pseudomonas moraviensis]MBH3442620.1 alpha-xenorhabdolysin family binary toxin subunit B [Pseudomonas moraviensis]
MGSANLYIKALGDELLGLNAAVGQADQLAANAITSAIVALETDDLRENLQALTALMARQADTQTDEAIKVYSTISSQLMDLCTDQISQLHAKLEDGVYNVQSASISNNRFRLAELADAKVELEQQLITEQAPIVELNADLLVLNNAINEFEKLTIIDRLKPLLDQLKTLLGNNTPTPQSAAMEAGIIVANKFLDEANELIKYQSLTKARDVIQNRISQREERVSSLTSQLRENDNRTRQLNDAQKVIPHRQTYVSETNKLVDALNAFADTIMDGPRDDILARGELVLKNSQALRSYMNKLQGRWLRG